MRRLSFSRSPSCLTLYSFTLKFRPIPAMSSVFVPIRALRCTSSDRWDFHSKTHMKRAGLDYWEYATLKIHDNWEAFLAAEHPNPERMFAMTTKGSTVLSQLKFIPGDWFIFGAEGSGLPDDIRSAFSAQNRIRLPMRPDNRSPNLSNAVAVTVFEAWRQQNYAGGC